MDGGDSVDQLPNYYAVLNVDYYGGTRDIPEAYYRVIKDQEIKQHYGHVVFDAYDCLSSPIDRVAYNEFYFNTPCWYSKPLWIAYRNERRRLEEKQLRRDREAREQASLALVEATATEATEPVDGVRYEIGTATAAATTVHALDTVEMVSTTAKTTKRIPNAETEHKRPVDRAQCKPTAKRVNKSTAKVTAPVTKVKVEETDGAIAKVTATAKKAVQEATEEAAKERKRIRTRAYRQRRAKREKLEKENALLEENKDAVEDVVVETNKNGKGVNSNQSSNKGRQGQNIHTSQVGQNSTKGTKPGDRKAGSINKNDSEAGGENPRDPGEMLARSRWADPNICNDGLAGHPHESWQVKAGAINCVMCQEDRCGSIFRCMICKTILCKGCYHKTTAVRRASDEASAKK